MTEEIFIPLIFTPLTLESNRRRTAAPSTARESPRNKLLTSPLTKDCFSRASKSLQNVTKKYSRSLSPSSSDAKPETGCITTPQKLSNSLQAIKKGAISSFNSLAKSTTSFINPAATSRSPVQSKAVPKHVATSVQSKVPVEKPVAVVPKVKKRCIEERVIEELCTSVSVIVEEQNIELKPLPSNSDNLHLHIAEIHYDPNLVDKTVDAVISPPHENTRSADILAQKRSVPGRSSQRQIKSDSELYSDARIQSILCVLRKNISPEEKLLAIKRNRDFWEDASKGVDLLPFSLKDQPVPSQTAKCTSEMSQFVQSTLNTQHLLEEPMDVTETDVTPSEQNASKNPASSNQSDANLAILEKDVDCTNQTTDVSRVTDTSENDAKCNLVLNTSTSSEPPLPCSSQSIPVECESSAKKTVPPKVVEPQSRSDNSYHPQQSEGSSKDQILPSSSDLTDDVFISEDSTNKKAPPKPSELHLKPKLANRRSLSGLLSVDVSIPEETLGPYPKPPKSPITVQEWVNSIDLEENERQEELPVVPSHGSVSHDSGYQSHHDPPTHESLSEDNLNLGAEARNIDGLHSSTISGPQKHKSSLSPARINLADFRNKQSSFNSETSTLSTVSSLSSVESLLESRREDPEEILLALGFGGNPTQDPLSRIPQRFLSQPSSARGVIVEDFLKQQEEEFQKQECSCLGYRGLTAMSPGDNKQPSAIANKIIERLGESSLTGRVPTTPGLPSPCHQNFVSTILAATAFKSSKTRRKSESILDPANREFLLRQGRDEDSKKNKKLILGMHTFNLNQEGDLIQHANDFNGKGHLTHPLSPQHIRWKQTFMLMDTVTTVKESEELKDIQEIQSLTETDNYPSSKFDDEVSSHDSSIASSLSRRRQLIRQMRFEEEDTRFTEDEKIEETVQLDSKCKEYSEEHLKKCMKIKDSFELEEMSFEEDTQQSSGNQSSVLVEGSVSESSGFAEESHVLPVPVFPVSSANHDPAISRFSNIPPVQITSWDNWDNTAEVHLTTYSGRLSDPNISCLSSQSSDNQLDDLNSPPLRKGSFPQPSPKRWPSNHCNFLWPSQGLKAASPLSSSETTLTNEMTNDTGHSESDAFSEGTYLLSTDIDGRCHSPYYQHEEADSNHSDQSVASSSPKERFEIVPVHHSGTNLYRSLSMTEEDIRPPRRKCQRSKSFPSPNALGSVLAQQQAFLEIQSLRLALEQYKAQGQRLEACTKRFLNYYPLLTDDQRKSLEYVQHLKLEVYREIGHMEALLNQHTKCLQSQKVSSEDAPKFQSALHQMRELLQEQSDLQHQLEKFTITESLEGHSQSCPTTDSRTLFLMEAVGEELMVFRRQLKEDHETMKTELQQMFTKTKEEILGTVKEWINNSKEEEQKSES